MLTRDHRILTALVQARAALRSGNPYHDSEGKFASGPGGGHGKHWAKRQKRKAKLKAKAKAEAREMKAGWREDWQQLKKDQRQEWRQLKREHKSELRDVNKGWAKDRAKIRKEAASGTAPKSHYREEWTSKRKGRQAEYQAAKERHGEQLADLRLEHKAQREGVREDHRRERELFIKELREQAKHGSRSDGGGRNRGASWLYHGFTRNTMDHERRFPSRRTHKASSAESILRHCLRMRGWTASFRRGELSPRDHYGLLRDIREYGRAWMHDEAMRLVEAHGHVERGLFSGAAGAVRRFFQRSKSFVAELIHAGVQALSGPGPIEPRAADIADQAAARQAQYLDDWYHEVVLNPPQPFREPPPKPITIVIGPTGEVQPTPETAVKAPSGKEFAARAEKYGNSAWGTAQKAIRAQVMELGHFREERRVLGEPKTEHCHDCPPLAAQGWVPYYTLPDIGETECNGMCYCHFEVREGPDDEPAWLVGPRPLKKRPSRKPELVAEPPGVMIEAPIAGPPTWDVPF